MSGALRGHLRRLAAVSVVSLAVGLGVLAVTSGEWSRGFGTLTAGWAAVNLAIVVASVRARPPGSVASFREFLALNLGLNVGYIGVGATMAILGGTWVQGAGVAVVVQGLLLLALDGWLHRLLPPQC